MEWCSSTTAVSFYLTDARSPIFQAPFQGCMQRAAASTGLVGLNAMLLPDPRSTAFVTGSGCIPEAVAAPLPERGLSSTLSGHTPSFP